MGFKNSGLKRKEDTKMKDKLYETFNNSNPTDASSGAELRRQLLRNTQSGISEKNCFNTPSSAEIRRRMGMSYMGKKSRQ